MRSNLTTHLYEDVIPFFDFLTAQNIKIGILTNGNANIDQCEVLESYRILCLGAGDVGAAKPSPIGFIACAQLWGIPTGRVLYIGDDYEKDIVGAKRVGMKTALIARDGKQFSAFDHEKYPAADMLLTSSDPAVVQDTFFHIFPSSRK